MTLATASPHPLTSQRSRWTVALAAGLTLLRDPKRVDQVLVLADIVNVGAYRRLAREMVTTSIWTRHTIDLARLRSLPDGTLGREYVRFLDANELAPEGLTGPPRIEDPVAASVARRLRQTHDVWHVMTGYEPDVRGEILLQAFTFGQVRTPSALLITLFGVLRWMFFYRGLARDVLRAYRRGKRAKALAGMPWEADFATPVDALRERTSLTS